MRLYIRIACVAGLVVVAALVPIAASCVKIKGGCVGMTVTPDSFSAKIGKARTFTAAVQGTSSDDCTFAFSDAGAGILQDLGVENATRLVLTASSGIYILRVTSVDDATRFCNVAVNVSNFGFAGSNPVTVTGVAADFFLGDVAIGGSGSHSFVSPAVVTAGGTVYTAVFQLGSVNDNTIRRYSLPTLGAANGTPEYDLAASGALPSFNFTGSPSRPRLAADGQGNGYWLRFTNSDELVRLRVGLAQGQLPNGTDDVAFSSLGIALDNRSDLTSDAAGNLYVLGELQSPLTNVHALGDPPTANIIRIHDAFGPSPVVTRVTPTPISVLNDFSFAVDDQSRLLIMTSAGVGGTGGQFYRLLPNGTLDVTFAPPGLNRPFDVKIDGEGAIYAVENRAASSRVLVLNEFGTQVAVVPPAGAPGNLQLQSVLGFAASSNGTLVLFDDLQGPTEPPASFILVDPN